MVEHRCHHWKVIGGLMALGVTRTGIWMFFRRRAVARGDRSYSEDIRVATGAAPYMSMECYHCKLCDLREEFLFGILSGLCSDRHY